VREEPYEIGLAAVRRRVVFVGDLAPKLSGDELGLLHVICVLRRYGKKLA
jgi:hypothetical protein